MGGNRGNNLGDVWLFFLVCYCMFGVVFGVSIIPKWLIKVPGLFRWFLELRTFCQNLDPQTSQLLPKCLKQYKKLWNHPYIYYFSYCRIWKLENFRTFQKAYPPIVWCCFVCCVFFPFLYITMGIYFYIYLWIWGSNDDKLSIKNISKSLGMNFISNKKHEMDIW